MEGDAHRYFYADPTSLRYLCEVASLLTIERRKRKEHEEYFPSHSREHPDRDVLSAKYFAVMK
ncbi:hypothetical protein EAI_07787 [Harpegnathos saltator]|uniref:Uncharacterized protein n=1 Tax=Harpegnathos saltator TaxID=610380 RepID=E2BHW7_HARSA|nr:hypothetical protein EAI_07787 [Harpegnathos saltator]